MESAPPTTYRPRWLGLAVAAGALAILLTLPRQLGYGPIDDAYISLRYADHLVSGQGLVWNPGQRVEGFSNPLWTLLLAAALGLGLDGPSAAVVLGLLLAATSAWLAAGAMRHLVPSAEAEPAALGTAVALTATLSAPLLCYGAAGLETGLYAALWVGGTGSCLHYLRQRTRAALRTAGACLAGLCWTRPEAPALVAVHGVAVLWLGAGSPSARLRDALRLVGPAVVATLGLLALRHAYYGEWLPNTYFAKMGTPSGALLQTGVAYVARYGLYSGAGLAVALILSARSLRRAAGIRCLLLVLLGQSILVALEGGDHMALYRFFAPATPLVAMLFGLSATRLSSRRWVAPVLCVAMGAVSSLSLARSPHPQRSRSMEAPLSTAHTRAQVEVLLAQHWGAFGRWLRYHSRPTDAVAALPIGAIGYYSGRPVIDLVGLTDPHIARRPAQTGAADFLGHEKFDSAYVLAQRPRFVLAHHFVTNVVPMGEAQYRDTAFYPAHRDLLAHPDLARHYRFVVVEEAQDRYHFFYERLRGQRPQDAD